ncbi:unnamed protein product [Prunus brigantina]
MAIVSPKPRIIDLKYPGLRFSIREFLHDPRGEHFWLLDHSQKVVRASRIKAGIVRFWPKLPDLETAATTTNGVAQPRGKQEGGENYFFQVVARLEVAGNVTNDYISFCRVFQSTPLPNTEFSIGEMRWAG